MDLAFAIDHDTNVTKRNQPYKNVAKQTIFIMYLLFRIYVMG